MPFFVQLKYAFKTERNYHFVMDYIPTGNLYDFLNGNRLTLQEAKVCGAEIVYALGWLHQHHIVYRDLKLENILISNDGHLVLTDFGLARTIVNNKKLDDQAGTFNYFAPGEWQISQRVTFDSLFSWQFTFVVYIDSNRNDVRLEAALL